MDEAPRRLRIMVLEDDVASRDMVKFAMEREGLEFRGAGRTEGFIAGAKEFQPDIILLDVNLPDGDGYDVCRALRKEPALAEIPVVFLTSHGDIDSRLKGFDAGGQDYLSKPFSLEELVARVRAHLAVRRRADQLARERDTAVLRDRVRQDMLDTIVHDLRSPLGTILITLELVRESGLVTNTEYARILSNAERAAELTVLLVNDILDLGSGVLHPSPSKFVVASLLDRVQVLLAIQARRKSLALVFEVGDPAAEAVTDQTLVLRLLLNLVANAINHSPKESTVRVRLLTAEGRLRMEVLDQGPGVPEAERERIFEKYYRSKGPEGGHGIGLAFCRMAAAALGGKVWAEAGKDGPGAHFVAELPLRLPAL